MPQNLKTFTRINIDAFPTFYIYQSKGSQPPYFHIFIFPQRFFNQSKKLPHKTFCIRSVHTMFFSQQINQILYIQFIRHIL